jgi:hypothetical protein
LQKSHDAVHKPVVESLLRIDLRHTPPHAACRPSDLPPPAPRASQSAAFYPDRAYPMRALRLRCAYSPGIEGEDHYHGATDI